MVESSLREAEKAALGIQAAHAALMAIDKADHDGIEDFPFEKDGYMEGCFKSSIEAHVDALNRLLEVALKNYAGFRKAMFLKKGSLSREQEESL
jgi:hypothetical protein